MKNFEFEHKGKKYWYSRSVAVLGIIVGVDENIKKHILANKRGKNTPDYQGCWCMPCGYIDFNESLEGALIREVFEETGVKLELNDFKLHSTDSIPEDDARQNVTIRYISDCLNINKYKLTKAYSDVQEVDSVKWIPLDEIDNYEWAFNHLDLMKTIFGIDRRY